MTVTGDVRSVLFTALSMAPGMPPGRCHKHQPDEPATPAVWLGVASRRPNVDGVGLVVSIPVTIVVDGADRAQVDMLDVLGDVVWDAAGDVGSPTRADPTTLDVGGPNLRAVVVDVDVDVHADTLCQSIIAQPVGVNP